MGAVNDWQEPKTPEEAFTRSMVAIEAMKKRERDLVADNTRLRAFVRKMFDAAHTHDYSRLEDATGIEQETAELLGIAWPYEETPGAHE